MGKRSDGWVALVLGAALMFSAGCAGSKLVEPRSIPRATAPLGDRVLLADLEREPDIITEQFQPFVAAMARSLRNDFDDMRAFDTVIQQRDLGPQGVGRALLVQYRLIDFQDVRSARAGYWGNLVLCSFTLLPCIWQGAIRPTNEVVSVGVELSVYQLTEALQMKSVLDPRSGSMVIMYDTSVLTPIVREEYMVSTEALIGYDNPQERLEFVRKMAADLVNQMLDASKEDLARAAKIAQRRPPPAVTAPPASAPASPQPGPPPAPSAEPSAAMTAP